MGINENLFQVARWLIQISHHRCRTLDIKQMIM